MPGLARSQRQPDGRVTEDPSDIGQFRSRQPAQLDGGNRNTGSFAMVYNRHLGDVTAYVVRRCGPDVAADIVSETFVTAWRRWSEMPSEPEVRPWLIGVARNTMANEHRRRRREQRRVQAAASHLSMRIGDLQQQPGHETRSWLAEALETLSSDDRELVLGTAWDGLSSAEMATILGISHQAARQRLRRARRRLRKALSATEEH